MPRGRCKARGYHQQGYKLDGRSPSEDLCPYCFSFGCDPGTMSLAFSHKIDERRRKGLCPCCGQPKAHCKCKSSEKITPGAHTIRAHNNKKLRAAKLVIQHKEAAYKAWCKNQELLLQHISEDDWSDIAYALHYHKTPAMAWTSLVKALHGSGLDIKQFAAGWNPHIK